MKRLVIVEDEKDYQDILRHYLEEAGYGVTAFASGEEALASLPRLAPDMVLLDVNLPGMDGYEICRRLRADPAFRRVPIIMITVQSSVAQTVKGLNLGADDYIAKPFDPKEVLARVSALFRQSRGNP